LMLIQFFWKTEGFQAIFLWGPCYRMKKALQAKCLFKCT
jgi:hypothetical protein